MKAFKEFFPLITEQKGNARGDVGRILSQNHSRMLHSQYLQNYVEVCVHISV